MAYDTYPGVDQVYSFAPQVRQAIANSIEIRAAISNAMTDSTVIEQAIIDAIEAAEQAGNLSFYKGTLADNVSFNTLTTAGVRTFDASHPGAPGGKSGYVIVISHRVNQVQQTVFTYAYDPQIWVRFSGSQGWSEWIRIDGNVNAPSTLAGPGFIADNVEGNKEHIITSAGAIGLPDAGGIGGVLITRSLNTIARQQFYYKYGFAVSFWMRFSGSNGWSEWFRMDAGADVLDKYQKKGAPSSTGSGFKVLPLALTNGTGSTTAAPTSANVIYDVGLSDNIPVKRARLALRDGNPRQGTFTPNQVVVNNLKIDGVQKVSTFTTPSNGDIGFSPWMDISTLDYVEFDYVAQTGPARIVGGGKINGVRGVTMPFEMWLEVEVPSWVPAFAIFGDSNSIGVGTTIPLHDAYMSVYGRRKGIFPVFYGHSGDTLLNNEDPTHHKWNRWAHLDSPDGVLDMMGSNDMATGDLTHVEFRRRRSACWAILREKVSSNIHVGTLKPRNTYTGNYDIVRTQNNSWLKTKPEDVREWHDLNSPVSDDDVTMNQEYNYDGIHMNSAGHLKLGNSIFKVTTVSGTDPTTEWVSITHPSISGGTLAIRRSGNTVQLIAQALKFTGTGTLSLANLIPYGYQPDGYFNLDSNPYWSSENSKRARLERGTLAIQSVATSDIVNLGGTWITVDTYPLGA